MHLSPEIRRPLFTRSKRTRHRRNSEMLARLGILKRDKSVGGIGYAAAETRYLNWQPWLSDKLSSEKITVDDSSPDGTDRIRVVFDKGQVVQTDPSSTVVFIGGG